jgi:DNA-binding transcriptional ArsR family regulator
MITMTTTSTAMSTTDELPPPDAVRATVDLLAAIAHPARLTVLLALARTGPTSAGRLQEIAGVEQSAMSHQLRALRDARLIRAERRGRKVIYALDDHHVAHIIEDALAHVSE